MNDAVILGAADNIWQLVSNFAAVVLGLIICLSFRKKFGLSVTQVCAYFAWHTITCILFFYFAMSNVSDSELYYIESFILKDGFELGTQFVIYFTSIFSRGLGMSYLGVFLIFNTIGAIGVLAFAGALKELSIDKKVWVGRLAVFLPFLPGLNFWSSGIGKDAITFAGAGIISWAILKFDKRYTVAIFGVACFLFARPHIAGLLLAGFAASIIIMWHTNILKKLLVSAIILPISVSGLYFGAEYSGLGSGANVAVLQEYVGDRQGQNLDGGSSFDLTSMGLSNKLFAYAFRPTILQASGPLAMIASIENLIVLLLLCFAVLKFFLNQRRAHRFAVFFIVTFGFSCWFVLAITTANIGIALRQKWMFLAFLIPLAFLYAPRRNFDLPRMPEK